MTEKEMIKFLRDHADYFQQSSFIGDIGRSIGWAVIKFLKILCDAAQGFFDKAFQILDFTESQAFVNFWNDYKTIMLPLLILFITVMGFRMMINMEKKPTPIMKNILILIVVSTSMLTIVPFMNDSVTSLKGGVLGENSVTESNEIINNALIDLNYIDSQNTLTDFDIHYNSLTTTRIKNLDIVAKVTPEDSGISEKAKQLYGKRLEDAGDGTESYTLAKMKSSFLGMVDPPYYYRYKVDYLTAILALVALIFVFVFYGFKIVLLTYEVIMSEILSVILAPNIGNSEKISKVFQAILNAFTTMAVIVLMIKIYSLSLTYVGQKSWDPLTEALMMLAISFAVILGPNVVQRVFGYDMGIGNEMSQMYFAMKMAHAVTSPITNAAGAVAGKAAKAGGEKIKDLISDVQKDIEDMDKENGDFEAFYGDSNTTAGKEGDQISGGDESNTQQDGSNTQNGDSMDTYEPEGWGEGAGEEASGMEEDAELSSDISGEYSEESMQEGMSGDAGFNDGNDGANSEMEGQSSEMGTAENGEVDPGTAQSGSDERNGTEGIMEGSGNGSEMGDYENGEKNPEMGSDLGAPMNSTTEMTGKEQEEHAGAGGYKTWDEPEMNQGKKGTNFMESPETKNASDVWDTPGTKNASDAWDTSGTKNASDAWNTSGTKSGSDAWDTSETKTGSDRIFREDLGMEVRDIWSEAPDAPWKQGWQEKDDAVSNSKENKK